MHYDFICMYVGHIRILFSIATKRWYFRFYSVATKGYVKSQRHFTFHQHTDSWDLSGGSLDRPGNSVGVKSPRKWPILSPTLNTKKGGGIEWVETRSTILVTLLRYINHYFSMVWKYDKVAINPLDLLIGLIFKAIMDNVSFIQEGVRWIQETNETDVKMAPICWCYITVM